ncbi:hypothetical protein POTOM_053439 [Populus tomentosa]|uniref:Uncharacterized protein n=1 Tax=Populus tomentosa TaxID=118781 RepID=A0A8X8C652_POPTO|nr:hypothetical protein POTOM_053439 [Populus tomentosa]
MDSLSIGFNTLRKATRNLCDEYKLGQGGFDRFSLQGIPSSVHLMRAKHLPTFYNVSKKAFKKLRTGLEELKTEVMLVARLLLECLNLRNSFRELVDPTLGGQWQESEVLKCIHIRLFCVQEAVADGPTMPQIVMMLSG